MVTPRINGGYRRAGPAGSAVQMVGILVLGIGIGIELAFKADIGFVAITAGSVIFAIGTKLKGR